jgi:hypothetical protein
VAGQEATLLGALTSTGSVISTHEGDLAKTLGDLSVASEGDVLDEADANVTLGNLNLDGNGAQISHPSITAINEIVRKLNVVGLSSQDPVRVVRKLPQRGVKIRT